MSSSEDWLQDPLRIMEDSSYRWRKLKSSNEMQHQPWRLFHYTTRLKLNGANFFCIKVTDFAHTPEDELRWYLDAFFFELMAACDILLQELNTVYAYDLQLQPEAVRWKNIKNKLPNELAKYVGEERRKDWFYEVQWYRNTTTHQYRNPIAGNRETDSLYFINVSLLYIDKAGKAKTKDISICKDYLSNMVNYISSVWGKMAQEFE